MGKNQNTLYDKLKLNRMHEAYEELRHSPNNMKIKFIIIFITVFFCSLCFTVHISKKTSEEIRTSIQPGYVWSGQNVEADFSFPIYKDEEDYHNETEDARNAELEVFLLDKNSQLLSLDRIDTVNNYNSESNRILTENLPVTATDSILRARINAFAELTKKVPDNIKNTIKTALSEVYKRGFINIPVDSITKTEIAVRISDNSEIILKKSRLLDSTGYKELLRHTIESELTQEEQATAAELARFCMVPNLKHSYDFTKQSKDLAAKAVPATEGIVRKGEIIIEKGQKVTDRTVKKIRSYYRSRFMKNEFGYTIAMFIGSFGHASLILSLLIIYLFFIRKRIFYDNSQVAILCSIIALVSVFGWLSLEIPSKLPVEYFILLPGLSMLAAIVFDSRTAFYVTVTMSLMIAGIRGNDYDMAISMLFAGTLAAYTVRDIQSRTQMFKSVFFIFIGFAIPIIFLSLESGSAIMPTVYKMVAALLNSSFSPIFTFGLLFLLERATGIVTDLRLVEYDNLKHPLIQKLSENAPGTYQHSISLASLAQKCAYAINANDLFVKVGAYFHDIGKLSKPEYYAENQTEIESKHDLISPKKSAEVIRNHVSEGIRLAKEYRVPQRIIDFIPMHHGTSLIKHFYNLALEEAGDKEVNEEDFRYPGPKPKTKESAILMICDAAEAMSRITGTDREQLEKAIERHIKDKILDGQFDECFLSMREINKIEETCVKYLAGISHQRVKYKEMPDSVDEQDEEIE